MTNKINLDEERHFKDNLFLLIDNLSSTCWESLSTNIQQKVTMVFCDDIGAIVAGHDEKILKKISRNLKSFLENIILAVLCLVCH